MNAHALGILAGTAAIAPSPIAPSHPAHPPTPQHVRSYLRAYRQVAKLLGKRAPGRNIVRWGLPGHRRPSDARILASLHVLDRMLEPPPTAPVVVAAPPAPAAPTPPSAVSLPSAGAGGVPSCASESGTNYSTGAANTNPSSGATGRYQIIPSTAQAYGCDLSTPGGQDACAARIYAGQGAGAWVGCVG